MHPIQFPNQPMVMEMISNMGMMMSKVLWDLMKD
jgi:hypothetical protein